jgi:hypothetical protein
MAGRIWGYIYSSGPVVSWWEGDEEYCVMGAETLKEGRRWN